MPSYIGLIHKDANSDFGVSFPDFPGVITAGTTLDDARAMAEEALALHVEGMVEDEPMLHPSRLEEISDRTGTFILVALG
jgi:predicted RNase H-like HicB family nuclease